MMVRPVTGLIRIVKRMDLRLQFIQTTAKRVQVVTRGRQPLRARVARMRIGVFLGGVVHLLGLGLFSFGRRNFLVCEVQVVLDGFQLGAAAVADLVGLRDQLQEFPVSLYAFEP